MENTPRPEYHSADTTSVPCHLETTHALNLHEERKRLIVFFGKAVVKSTDYEELLEFSVNKMSSYL